jgi:hypothetical protein
MMSKGGKKAGTAGAVIAALLTTGALKRNASGELAKGVEKNDGEAKVEKYKRENSKKIKANRKLRTKAKGEDSDDGHVDTLAEMANFGQAYPVRTDEGDVTFAISMDYESIAEGDSTIKSLSESTDLTTPIARGAGLAGAISGLMMENK